MARVALVTGGTRGIGAAISKALKAAGYKVAASYAGNDTAAEKFKGETGIPVYKWDVSSFDACAAGIKQVESDLGPVDVLVNNAGITKDGAFHKMTLEQWNAVINTNLGSLFNMTRPVIEGMRARKFGRIINISSINGQKGQFGQVNYSAASTPRWCRRYRRRCWKNPSCRKSRSTVSASPRRLRARWCSWPPTMPAPSPVRRSPSMAGSTWCDNRPLSSHFMR
jgi:NADP-dependent 3-hydroxy acid dehydrogenase YdfG